MSDLINVRKIREKFKMTQQELAERCGVSLRTVQNWENGKTIPTSALRLLKRIDSGDEIVSSSATDSAINATGVNGSTVTVRAGRETERLMSLLEKAAAQTDEHLTIIHKRDEQIDRLLTLVEQLSKKD